MRRTNAASSKFEVNVWPVLLVGLIGLIAWGRGGYVSWSVLGFELGVACLAVVYLWSLATELDATSYRKVREQHRLHSRLPFRARHAARWLGLWGGATQAATIVEILPTGGEQEQDSSELQDYSPLNTILFWGIPFPRTGLGIPLLLLSVWLALSLLPFSQALLEVISPQASLYSEEAAVLSGERPFGSLSIQPFRTLDGIGIWIGIVAFFYVGVGVARRFEATIWISRCLVLLGTVSAAHGIVQSLMGISNMVRFGTGSLVRAQGSFGNPNHYAGYVMMMFLCSLGWLEAERERRRSRAGRSGPRSRGDQAATVLLLLTPLILMAVAIVLSLSRSAIAFTAVGAVAFLFLVPRKKDDPSVRRRSRSALQMAILVGVVVGAVSLCLGADLVVQRFASLDEHLRAEVGRVQVWKDSLEAIPDYWMSGSGLGTYRYVGPNYRSFGGPVFFSWAHNDYLQLLIELGVPGALFLALLAASMLGAGYQRRKAISDAGDVMLGQLHAGFAAAILGIAAHSLTDFSLHLTANFALLALLIAVVVGARPRTHLTRS